MGKQKLILIDADALCFHSSRETLEESIQVLNDKIQNMYEKTGATHSCFFISQGKYFRHAISNDYKKSRDNTKSPLKWLQTLKMYLKEAYNAQSMYLVEADDLTAYWYNQKFYWAKFTNPHSDSIWMISNTTEFADEFEEMQVILCSPDKDLLQSIEGTFFNYSYKLVDKTNSESVEKGWWVTTTKEEAYYNFWVSMITGDVGDSVKGCEGRGIKYAEKIFEYYGNNLHEVTLSAYAERYGMSQGIYEFQKNYRLLHLLSTDADFIQEIGELPTFPIINEIKPKEIIIAEYE